MWSVVRVVTCNWALGRRGDGVVQPPGFLFTLVGGAIQAPAKLDCWTDSPALMAPTSPAGPT